MKNPDKVFEEILDISRTATLNIDFQLATARIDKLTESPLLSHAELVRLKAVKRELESLASGALARAAEPEPAPR